MTESRHSSRVVSPPGTRGLIAVVCDSRGNTLGVSTELDLLEYPQHMTYDAFDVLQACRRLDHLEAQIHPDAISPRAVRALHRAAPLPRLDLSVLAAYSDVEIAREPVLSVRIRT